MQNNKRKKLINKVINKNKNAQMDIWWIYVCQKNIYINTVNLLIFKYEIISRYITITWLRVS